MDLRMKTILNKDYWIFGLFFALYFFIWAACTPFLSIWLQNVGGLSSTEVGIIFSAMAISALCLQPFFGIISDKLGLRKNLLWGFIILLVFIAPFFIYLFPYLLKTNIILGAVVGGAYLGACFNGGSGTIEAYIEKVSQVNSFEYGQVRMFGCIGAATGTYLTGAFFATNPNLIFIISSVVAVVLGILFSFAKTKQTNLGTTTEEIEKQKAEATSKESVLAIFKNRKFWWLTLYVVGVTCIYEVFDQQFAIYFTHFFSTEAEGTRVFGNLYTTQIIMEAVVMLLAPFFIRKIGAKNALIYAGVIMSFRILGSSFADGPIMISALKLLHAIEVPVLLVAIFKYITANFDIRLSATIYLIGFQFSKQLGAIFLSAIAGSMYDTAGFKNAYLLLGLIAITFTIISMFTLSNDKKAKKKEQRDPELVNAV